MAKSDAEIKASESGDPRGAGLLKKIKAHYGKVVSQNPGQNVRVMFQDEAGFGRINKPKRCWCRKGKRPSTPCHHIREYRYAYGAVEPRTGAGFFLVMPYCNTVCMNIFLRELSKQYPNEQILLICDGARWHKSQGLEIPAKNPIEQIWKELRKSGFKNEVFTSLDAVVKRLCQVIHDLSNDVIRSITARKWIIRMF